MGEVAQGVQAHRRVLAEASRPVEILVTPGEVTRLETEIEIRR